MKLLIKKGFYVTSVILFSYNSLANAQFSFKCPDKFIATVTDINDIQTQNFNKIEVSFQVIQTLKGKTFSTKKIQVIKDGLVEFKVGQVYTLDTRENWLCNATILNNKS